MYTCMCEYLSIHNKYQYTYIFYVNKLLFWTQIIVINCLTALIYILYIIIYIHMCLLRHLRLTLFLSWGENSARFVVCSSAAERVDVSMWSLNTWLLGLYGRHMFFIMPLRWDSKHSLYCVLEQERRVKVCACVFMRWCSVCLWRYYRGQIQHMVISASSFDIHKQTASERLTHAYIPSVM